jgi:dienelactone hydrolase
MIRSCWLVIFCIVGCSHAEPAPKKGDPTTKTLHYKHDGATFEGMLSWDPAITSPRPAVLIAHERAGYHGYVQWQVMEFAKAGYVCAAADLYGKGIAPKDRAEVARRLSDRESVAARLQAALNALAQQPQVAPHKIAGIGYGHGATAFLDLVRGDADLVGVACLHGDWSTPKATDNKITCRILALMGTDDPRASIEKFAAFEREMKAAGADWDAIRFGGVGSDFTNEHSTDDPKSNLAFDGEAASRAHLAVRQFLGELFPKPTVRSFAAPKEAPKIAPKPAAPKGVPDKAMKVLQHVDEHDRAMEGYEGGRNFGNFEGRLPASGNGSRIRYREWDVNPLRSGVNRGPERLVTGSDGSAYFTDDHYSTFQKIR